VGRHSSKWQEAIRRGPAPSWTGPGWKLLALSLAVATIVVSLGADRDTYWFQATPESARPPDASPPPEEARRAEPGVSLTVGPERPPSPSLSPVGVPTSAAGSATPPPAPATMPPATPRAGRNTPGRPASCTVTLRRTSEWEQAFTATVTVTNRAATAVTGWTLRWRFRGEVRIRQVWNGRHTQNGRAVSVRDDGWNASIGSGGSVTFGFEATAAARGADPDRFTLNGVTCGPGGGSGAGRDWRG
jgi:hypothetical protein